MVSLRFSERQRLARILIRLTKAAGEAHDLLPQIPSTSTAGVSHNMNRS